MNKKIFSNIKDGLIYIYNTPILLKTIISTAIVGTFAMNLNVLVPVFATNILHEQEAGFGFLMSFMGVGSLIGAMTIATSSKSAQIGLLFTLYH